MEEYPNANSSFQSQNFIDTSKSFLKKRKQTFPVVCYFAWKLELEFYLELVT